MPRTESCRHALSAARTRILPARGKAKTVAEIEPFRWASFAIEAQIASGTSLFLDHERSARGKEHQEKTRSTARQECQACSKILFGFVFSPGAIPSLKPKVLHVRPQTARSFKPSWQASVARAISIMRKHPVRTSVALLELILGL